MKLTSNSRDGYGAKVDVSLQEGERGQTTIEFNERSLTISHEGLKALRKLLEIYQK